MDRKVFDICVTVPLGSGSMWNSFGYSTRVKSLYWM